MLVDDGSYINAALRVGYIKMVIRDQMVTSSDQL